MLAVSLTAAFVEHGSTLAERARDGRPWPFWVAVVEPGRSTPAIHLGVYRPHARGLAMIRVPENAKLQGKTTLARAYSDALRATGDSSAAVRAVEDLAQARVSELSLEPVSWEGAGRLRLTELAEGDEDEVEPAAAAARALKARGRSPREVLALLKAAFRGLRAGDRSAADGLLLALELRRVPYERLEAGVMPDDAAAPAFLQRVFAPPPPGEDRAPVVEVLNGTDLQGLAASAGKVLRLRGVDVTVFGPASRPRSRTAIYDRTGDFGRAARVREALGCPAAVAATRIDPLRGVDASVELGMDCADAVAD